jgi:hypothetical protein
VLLSRKKIKCSAINLQLIWRKIKQFCYVTCTLHSRNFIVWLRKFYLVSSAYPPPRLVQPWMQYSISLWICYVCLSDKVRVIRIQEPRSDPEGTNYPYYTF